MKRAIVNSVGPVAVLVLSCAARAQDSNKPVTSFFNQGWLDSVVSIECEGCNPAKPEELKALGTGFLVVTEKSHILLVTVAHVLEALRCEPPPRIGYRLAGRVLPNKVVWEDDLTRDGYGPWHYHSRDADVAVRYFSRIPGVDLPVIDVADHLRSSDLTPGAPLLILGYPLGLRSAEFPRPIVRHGIVALVEGDSVLADAFVFPGNSGGPVVYSPPIKVGLGLKSPIVAREKLVGLVQAFRGWASGQNTGLSYVVPIERLLELMNAESVRALDNSLSIDR